MSNNVEAIDEFVSNNNYNLQIFNERFAEISLKSK